MPAEGSRLVLVVELACADLQKRAEAQGQKEHQKLLRRALMSFQRRRPVARQRVELARSVPLEIGLQEQVAQSTASESVDVGVQFPAKLLRVGRALTESVDQRVVVLG